MAIYTPLTEAEIQQHLLSYDLGMLIQWRGIAQGVENSNFYVETTRGRYILTLFEKRITEAELPYCLGLMEWLAKRNISCPQPLPDKDGKIWRRLKGKPATIVTFLNGDGVEAIAPYHMGALGVLAANLHKAAQGFPEKRENTLSLPGWQKLAEKIGARAEEISPGLAKLIAAELAHLQRHWPRELPTGPVHADLFPDNVFFEGKTLSGVIDFYFACDDFFAYDLAICVASWCFDTQHRFMPERLHALMRGYESVRALTDAEQRHFPTLLRGAALRFLLTRAYDILFHPAGAVVTPKDPREYLAKLQFFQRGDTTR